MAPELSTLGVVHTLLSLAAVGVGIASLARQGRIRLATSSGKVYSVLTALTALTALGIHQRAAFGPGHVLAVLTLLALMAAFIAARRTSLRANQVQAVSLSATLLFHAIPGSTEALTRLPPSAPLLSTPESPIIKGISAMLFIVFLVVAFQQVRRAKSES